MLLLLLVVVVVVAVVAVVVLLAVLRGVTHRFPGQFRRVPAKSRLGICRDSPELTRKHGWNAPQRKQ